MSTSLNECEEPRRPFVSSWLLIIFVSEAHGGREVCQLEIDIVQEMAVIVPIAVGIALFYFVVLRRLSRPPTPTIDWIKQWDWGSGYFDPRINGAVHLANMETDLPTRAAMVLITGTDSFTGEGHQGVYRLSVRGTGYEVRRVTPSGEGRFIDDFIVPRDQHISNDVKKFWDSMALNLAEI